MLKHNCRHLQISWHMIDWFCRVGSNEVRTLTDILRWTSICYGNVLFRLYNVQFSVLLVCWNSFDHQLSSIEIRCGSKRKILKIDLINIFKRWMISLSGINEDLRCPWKRGHCVHWFNNSLRFRSEPSKYIRSEYPWNQPWASVFKFSSSCFQVFKKFRPD